jgi:hypothetical protein
MDKLLELLSLKSEPGAVATFEVQRLDAAFARGDGKHLS